MRIARCLTWGLLVVAMTLAGCASGPPVADAETVRDEIEAIFEVWGQVVMDGDVDGFLALWHEECVKMQDHFPTTFGANALRQGFGGAVEAGARWENFDVVLDEVMPAGEFAWAMGIYSFDMFPPGATEPLLRTGSYLTVFQRQPDGSWKVYRDAMMDGTS